MHFRAWLFWHQHPGCARATIPATNTEFWFEKLRRNVERDKRVQSELRSAGWRVEVIWECETTKSLDSALDRILAAPE